jgi:hypothetical protein
MWYCGEQLPGGKKGVATILNHAYAYILKYLKFKCPYLACHKEE